MMHRLVSRFIRMVRRALLRMYVSVATLGVTENVGTC